MSPVLPNQSGTEAWNEFLRKVGQVSRLPGDQLATLPKPVLEAGRPPDYFDDMMELADDAGENPNDECRNPKETRNSIVETSP